MWNSLDSILVLLSAFVFFDSSVAILLRFWRHYTYFLFYIKYRKILSLLGDNIHPTLLCHIAPVSLTFCISFLLLWSEIPD